MTKRECKELFAKIYNKYSKEMWIHEGDCGPDNVAYSYILRREIVLPHECFSNPREWDILVLLHEIGHIKTNNHKMTRYEKEFHATQWSATEAKKIGFNVKNEWKDVYQGYIWDKRQISINMKAKNVAAKEDLVIKW